MEENNIRENGLGVSEELSKIFEKKEPTTSNKSPDNPFTFEEIKESVSFDSDKIRKDEANKIETYKKNQKIVSGIDAVIERYEGIRQDVDSGLVGTPLATIPNLNKKRLTESDKDFGYKPGYEKETNVLFPVLASIMGVIVVSLIIVAIYFLKFS